MKLEDGQKRLNPSIWTREVLEELGREFAVASTISSISPELKGVFDRLARICGVQP